MEKRRLGKMEKAHLLLFAFAMAATRAVLPTDWLSLRD